MHIFVGLGNPGAQYVGSRHNVGWKVLDELSRFEGAAWKFEKVLEAETLQVGDALLVKPLTFMNLSGTAVQKVMKKYDFGALGKKDFHSLFVVYDDLDVEVGKYKVVFGSGPKVHNGVNDIKEKLGTDQFWHIRIGTDGRNGDRSMDPQEYVLKGFNKEEQILIDKVTESIVELLAKKVSVST